jgi:ribonuclease G
VDFIDMKSKGDQKKVFQKMKSAMADDKSKHNILPISQLGIMQITRQRHDESNSSGVYEPCPYCKGRGIVKSPRSVSIEIQRLITSAVRAQITDSSESNPKIKVFLHPRTLRRLRGPDSSLIKRLELNYNLEINFEAAETYHIENYKIIDEVSGKEIR